MTKKDEKDADRPHYYSQFWLDVAAGRKVIGAKSEDGTDQADADLSEPIPLARKGGRANPNIVPADGYRETRAQAAVADETYDEEEEEEEFPLPEDEEPDTVDEVSDEDIPTIVDDTPEEFTPDIEPEPFEEEEQEPEEEDEEFYDEEEEEDEDEWPARGRKKPKPGRQAKVPKPPSKKPRRGGRF
jgi:alpha-glucosidase (family GH31 glycosyl hydrolase)